MPVHIKPDWWIRERDLTDDGTYAARRTHRRAFLRQAALGTAALGAAGITGTLLGCKDAAAKGEVPLSEPMADLLRPGYPAPRAKGYDAGRPLTKEAVAASHNNFYEFTTDKDKVWRRVGAFQPRPWTLTVTGAVDKTRTFDIDDLEKMGLETRHYRFRCVEAWAMAVPWVGIPLKTLLDKVGVAKGAKYVRLVSFNRPDQAPGQAAQNWYKWPYYEGLSLKEATHPLTMLATGIYGHALPRQHGAPVRLVVPWKYGYKNIKSITRIEVLDYQPPTFWNDLQPSEYDFLANVNPKWNHPRWSQAYEKMIGTGKVHNTAWLNGYAREVGHLYPLQPERKGWDTIPRPFR